jgi:hypothetical protein
MTSSQAEVIRQAANIAESRYRRRLREQRRTFSNPLQRVYPEMAEAAPGSPSCHTLAPNQAASLSKPSLMPAMAIASPALGLLSSSTPGAALSCTNATCDLDATRAGIMVPRDAQCMALAVDGRPAREARKNDGVDDKGTSPLPSSPASSSSPSGQSAEYMGWPEADALDLELSTSSSEGRSQGPLEDSDASAEHSVECAARAEIPRKRVRTNSTSTVEGSNACDLRSWRQGTAHAEFPGDQNCSKPRSAPRPKIVTMWNPCTKHIEDQVAAVLFAREYSENGSLVTRRRGP